METLLTKSLDDIFSNKPFPIVSGNILIYMHSFRSNYNGEEKSNLAQ